MSSSSSSWWGDWQQGDWWHQGGWQQWWQPSSSWWSWGSGGVSRKRKGEHQGGWSEQEGAWRHNPAPDGYVIKAPFPSPKLLGDGVMKALKEEAHEVHGVTLVKVRGRESTAGRAQTRQQGTTTHQITIIGRECMRVYKLFRQAAVDKGLSMPKLPHIRIPAELEEVSAQPLPPHPDSCEKRCAPQPPAPQGISEPSGGGGLPATSSGAELVQGTKQEEVSSGGGGLPPTSSGAVLVQEVGRDDEGSSGGGLPLSVVAVEPDFEADWGGDSSEEEEADETGELVIAADREVLDDPSRRRQDEPSVPLPILEEACCSAAQRRGLNSLGMQLLWDHNTTKVLSPEVKPFKVAFCTTSVGRNHQVRDALPLQLMTLWPWREHVRVYFVDYNEDTELCQFIFDTCREVLEVGFLQYARCSQRNSWHASICKNGAHYWAAEWADMLVNMDGDRIIGPDLPLHILEHLNIHQMDQKPRVGHYNSTADTGTYGTIACPTKLFVRMRGYNEEFFPCGFQDAELLQRAAAAGATLVKVSSSNCVGTSLPNDVGNDWKMQSKVKNANVDMKDMQGKGKVLKFGHMDQLNRSMSQEHIAKYGAVMRNCATSWKPVAVEPISSRPSWLAPAPPQTIGQQVGIPSAVSADTRRVQVVCFGWRNLPVLFPDCHEAKALKGLREEPATREIRQVTDAVGWRADSLLRAVDYLDTKVPSNARGHLGFHDGHMSRILTRDGPGDPVALAHIVGFLQKRFRETQRPTVTLACYCADGAVESVALTWVLQSLMEMLGFVPLDPVFIGRQTTWPDTRCQRRAQSCRECRPEQDSPIRRQIRALLQTTINTMGS